MTTNKNRRIDIRLTQKEYNLIQNKKEAKGYKSLSQYIRSELLENSLSTEHMIKEIYEEICKKWMNTKRGSVNIVNKK